MSNPELSSWVGLDLDEYHIERQIGEGAFTRVYYGKHQQDGSEAAFKVAKPIAQVGKFSSDSTMFFPTQALVQITGAFMHVQLDAAELLAIQAEKLQSCPHKHLLKLEQVVNGPLASYYRCEYLHGQNLRTLMQTGRANVSHLIAVATALRSIFVETSFQSHGDLKPDNIMVSNTGVKLIDPGYFGALGVSESVAVTTPAYYPFLEPDDLLAFGIMAWELLTGEHPLPQSAASSEKAAPANIDRHLFEKMHRNEVSGNYFASGFLTIKKPSQIKTGLNTEWDKTLLKLLRLQIDEQGILKATEGFANFAEIAKALASLK